MAHISGKLSKRSLHTLPTGRHGDGNGLFLVVKPTGSRSWIVRLTVKGRRNSKGSPLRTDLGLGGVDLVDIQEAREMALKYRALARKGVNPKMEYGRVVPTFEEMARDVHKERLPTWKNKKHGDQFINTLRDYTFPKIGKMSVADIEQPEVLSCLSPIWTLKHETAKRVAQRIKVVLDVAKSKGFRDGENPVTAIKDAGVLPKVKQKVKHHEAMKWGDVPAFFDELRDKNAMSAQALMFTCLAGARTGEVLNATWDEFDLENATWTIPEGRMKGEIEHRVPLTPTMMEIVAPLKAMDSKYVFEGQKRHRPLSNMAMLMLLRRMKVEGVTVHGFRSTFRDWASEVANAPRELAEMSLAHKVGSDVERAYARSDLLDKRRVLMERWARYVTGEMAEVVSIA